MQVQFLQRVLSLFSRQQSPPSYKHIAMFDGSSQTESLIMKFSEPHVLLSCVMLATIGVMSEKTEVRFGHFKANLSYIQGQKDVDLLTSAVTFIPAIKHSLDNKTKPKIENDSNQKALDNATFQ